MWTWSSREMQLYTDMTVRKGVHEPLDWAILDSNPWPQRLTVFCVYILSQDSFIEGDDVYYDVT